MEINNKGKIKENLLLLSLATFGWMCVSFELGTWSFKIYIVCLFLVYTTDLIGSKLLGHSLHKPLTKEDWE